MRNVKFLKFHAHGIAGLVQIGWTLAHGFSFIWGNVATMRIGALSATCWLTVPGHLWLVFFGSDLSLSFCGLHLCPRVWKSLASLQLQALLRSRYHRQDGGTADGVGERESTCAIQEFRCYV